RVGRVRLRARFRLLSLLPRRPHARGALHARRSGRAPRRALAPARAEAVLPLRPHGRSAFAVRAAAALPTRARPRRRRLHGGRPDRVAARLPELPARLPERTLVR